jgi:hypothetical protein
MKSRTRKSRKGSLQRFFPLHDESPFLGIGGYGIVFQDKNTAIKLLHEADKCQELVHEAKIQQKVRKALKNTGIQVPRVLEYSTYPVQYKNRTYLCGIAMDVVPTVKEFDEQVHIVLGQRDTSDLDESWGQKIGQRVGPENPTRGFFASPDFLEELWEERGSKWTVEKAAYTMGQGLRLLLNAGIVPDDVEWIYGGDDEIWLLDFGLCWEGYVEPLEYLNKKGTTGLASDIYVPHEDQKGYTEFLEGFMG